MQTSGKHLTTTGTIMTLSDERKRLVQQYGPEIVIECCREWKTHWGNGAWGKCGICRDVPRLVKGKTWDE